MTIAHRHEQIFDNIGETVTIKQRTAAGVDDFNSPKFTWATETTETAVITNATTKTFAELAWVHAGQMQSRDRIGYFKSDSVIAENKRVILASGERYEADIVDTPKVFGSTGLKVVKLRRLTEQ